MFSSFFPFHISKIRFLLGIACLRLVEFSFFQTFFLLISPFYSMTFASDEEALSLVAGIHERERKRAEKQKTRASACLKGGMRLCAKLMDCGGSTPYLMGSSRCGSGWHVSREVLLVEGQEVPMDVFSPKYTCSTGDSLLDYQHGANCEMDACEWESF